MTFPLQQLDLSVEPELHPLYPNPVQIQPLLSANSGLSPLQKTELVVHCISRACLFADLAVLQYLVSDPQAQAYVDLGVRDEDGLGLVSLTIYGFGAESERDVEREECVRFLISQGADVNAADNGEQQLQHHSHLIYLHSSAGWTPLHHAALRSPPTLISYLMTHGCSLFSVTHRNLTALDIVTAHTTVPGREDTALLLEEAMRGEGWTGGRMEATRRLVDERMKRRGNQRNIRNDVGRVLGVSPRWWGDVDSDGSSSSSEEEDDQSYDQLYVGFVPL
jgi:Ankyrin repeats (many copies)